MARKAPISLFQSSDVAEQRTDFNPTRLTLARKRRGLTKIELARKISVEVRSVTAYESGEYSPSDDAINRLRSVLQFPAEFFYGDDLEEPRPDTASFRAMSKMTAAQRDMALGEGTIALQLNEWIEARFELPSADLPDLSREPTPEAAAYSLRRLWALGELPIKNMIHLLEAKGVRVFSLAIEAREVDAFSMWKDLTPLVFLNTHKSTEHSRYDAAHELGHLVLHRHASPQGREAEREADEFASAFLMPRSSVLAHAQRFPTLAGLIQLKKIWNTSVAALNYRLHAIGLTTDWQYRNLCIQIAKNGFRTKEPDESPRESSQVLPKVFSTLLTEGISRFHVAKALSITVSELQQLLFGLVMTSLEGGRVGKAQGKTQIHLTVVRN
jgi:Zn-dependent peptidase ImmA (M78 family)/DNA-binding transcriptional regulator YiaG